MSETAGPSHHSADRAVGSDAASLPTARSADALSPVGTGPRCPRGNATLRAE